MAPMGLSMDRLPSCWTESSDTPAQMLLMASFACRQADKTRSRERGDWYPTQPKARL
jgi:hypothetical protein